MRKPRPILLNAIDRAIERSRKLSPNDTKILKRMVTDSVEALKHGKGRRDDINNLIDAFNTGEELSVLGICSDANSREAIQNGQNALVNIFHRQKERGAYEPDASDVKSLEEAVFIHAVQLDYCSLGEYAKAAENVKRKAARALAGDIPANTEVLA